MKKFSLIIIALTLLLVSCTPEPQAINYGSDMCDFCKMSIVDQQYAAELVTEKAKVYKFDAIECMLQFKKEKKEMTFAFELVNTYDTPEELIPASNNFYLISPALPSPMGANLTAFSKKEIAEEMQKAKGGELYNWQALTKQFIEKGFAQNSFE